MGKKIQDIFAEFLSAIYKQNIRNTEHFRNQKLIKCLIDVNLKKDAKIKNLERLSSIVVIMAKEKEIC